MIRATQLLSEYDYAPAKSEIENFFWKEFADNYLEMCKQRLYTGDAAETRAARYTLYTVLLTTCKLLAPYLPYITETIYQGIFANTDGSTPLEFQSIHLSAWPQPKPSLQDDDAEQVGVILLEIAGSVRRFKSENSLSLGTELQQLQIATLDIKLAEQLNLARQDITSITRAAELHIGSEIDSTLVLVHEDNDIRIGIRT